jgi:hypothetical protein
MSIYASFAPTFIMLRHSNASLDRWTSSHLRSGYGVQAPLDTTIVPSI